MKNENGFMGQVDLLALLGAELKVVDSVDCMKPTQKGRFLAFYREA